ncbi:hypothetical protein AL01_04365 [Bombella intestini]|uniref:TM2 domain-containing protein n=1 Tax=Bombella intestini TaxID=1539051 RepID=A0A1S8GQK2_9PROT|nr:TM2 domain-containing protein [Bombella intestini]OOL18965.1 hypothetical protein AL01_04365 [Bombella intestini]
MRGTILNYDVKQGEGIISGDDGKRYSFKGSSFGSEGALLRNGTAVDFEVQDDKAQSIFAVPPVRQEGLGNVFDGIGGKSKMIAGLLALFCGGVGVHKFYLGYNRTGVIMLLVTIFGIILLGFPSLIIAIIAFIEGIIYMTKSDEDFYLTYVKNKKEWF